MANTLFLSQSFLRGFLMLFFFISGMCGLIYEVVWSRMLTLVMGNTVFATSTVLSAFMGGLALGSWILGRMVDRYGRPLWLYGVMECVLGIYCLMLPWLMDSVIPIYRLFYQSFGASHSGLTIMQLMLSGIILLIPSALMGGTLPVLCKYFLREDDEVGKTAGSLYALNTIGAVVGAGAAGFLFIPSFGVRATLYGAAIVNLMIGIFAFLAVRVQGDRRSPQGTSRFLFRSGDPWDRRGWSILLIFSMSGASALMYEVAWTRCLAVLLGPSIHAFSLMLCAFISGLALGSWIFSRMVDRMERLFPVMALMQWVTAVSTLILILLVNRLPELIRDSVRSSSGSFSEIQMINATIIFLVLIVPATCLGSIFPMAVKSYSQSISSFGRRIGNLYAGNTIGAVMGSLLGGFWFIPNLGVQATLQVTVLINGALASILLWLSIKPQRRLRLMLSFGSIGALLLAVLYVPRWSVQDQSSGPYKYVYENESRAQQDLRGLELLYYREGVTGTVAVKQRGDQRFLMIDGKVDASNGDIDMVTQTLLGHIPLLVAQEPRDVLVVGLASGVTLAAVSQYPVDRIDCLEVSYEVRDASNYFIDINRNVLQDDRVNLIIQDGRNHLLLSDQQYDVIISEPSNPWMAGIANLYTREFFELAKDRLRPQGVMAQWIEAYHLPNPMLRSIIKTYLSVFPYVSLWTSDPSDPGDLFLLGSKNPLIVHVDDLKRKLAQSKISTDLSKFNSQSWWLLMQRALADRPILMRSVGEVPLHTDDRPFLEFELPKTIHSSTWLENARWIHTLIQQRSPQLYAQRSLVLSNRDRAILKSAQATVAAQFAMMGIGGI